MAIHPSWMVCNDDGHVVVEAVSGELMQATAMSTGRRVAVILPAGEALATESDAPAKGAAKLAQVVPYALEERVADEIEHLHFAIGDRDSATGRVPVVVLERARLESRLAELRAAGLNPQAIYSAATLLPAMPGQMIGLLEGDTLTLRTADAPPLVLPALSISDAFEMALSMQTSAVAGLEPAPLGLLLYAGHEEWEAHQLNIDAFRDRFTGVKVQLLPRGSLSVLAPAAAAGDAVNLLQGALAVASPHELTLAFLARGRGARRLAALPAPGFALLRIESPAQESKPRSTPASRKPSAPPCPDSRTPPMPGAVSSNGSPKSRVVARAARCCRSSSPSPMRAAPCRTRRSKASHSVTALLDLRIDAPDAASLDAIGQQLRAASWQADIMGGSASGDTYRGRLQIRKAGA